MSSSVLCPPSSPLRSPSSAVRPLSSVLCRLSSVLPWLGALVTGLLLAASFAPFDRAELAWFALIPLLLASRYVAPGRLFLLGLSSGALFWLISLFWLTRVSGPGWFGLALVCASFLGLFTWLVGRRLQQAGALLLLPNLLTMALAVAAWVGVEYFRSIVATGFPWNLLGLSQHRNLPVIQLAAWGGVYLVSAVIVWVNAGVALTLLRYLECRGHWGRRLHAELSLGFLGLAGAFAFGFTHLAHTPIRGQALRVALVQTGIPQDEKWDREKIELIYSRLFDLTSNALLTRPDLIIWPETALPDDVRSSPTSYDVVHRLCTNGVPLLVGSMDTEWPDAGPPTYYNSSFLFDPEGAITAEYRKRHLVPFGEYVPLRHLLPFMKAMTPIAESFDGGRTSTVFQLAGRPVSFSVLICFEDAVASLARESVRNGARLIVNQTNDAWFDPWWGQWQHMAQSVLRAVENGVPVLRCANTGVSCFIDQRGRVTNVLAKDGQVGFPGFTTGEVRVPGADLPLTWYTRHGDVFALTCTFVTVLAAFAAWRSRRAAPAA